MYMGNDGIKVWHCWSLVAFDTRCKSRTLCCSFEANYMYSDSKLCSNWKRFLQLWSDSNQTKKQAGFAEDSKAGYFYRSLSGKEEIDWVMEERTHTHQLAVGDLSNQQMDLHRWFVFVQTRFNQCQYRSVLLIAFLTTTKTYGFYFVFCIPWVPQRWVTVVWIQRCLHS